MAVMISVEKRGTNLKHSINKAANILNKKIKRVLYLSIILNIALLTYIIIRK